MNSTFPTLKIEVPPSDDSRLHHLNDKIATLIRFDWAPKTCDGSHVALVLVGDRFYSISSAWCRVVTPAQPQQGETNAPPSE